MGNVSPIPLPRTLRGAVWRASARLALAQELRRQSAARHQQKEAQNRPAGLASEVRRFRALGIFGLRVLGFRALGFRISGLWGLGLWNLTFSFVFFFLGGGLRVRGARG